MEKAHFYLSIKRAIVLRVNCNQRKRPGSRMDIAFQGRP